MCSNTHELVSFPEFLHFLTGTTHLLVVCSYVLLLLLT